LLPKDPRAVAAIHEAGHAVVSLALQTGVRRTDILPGRNGREGLTNYHHRAGRFEGSRAVMERRGATVMGGMAAVWLASGREEKHRISPGDVGAVWEYVYQIVPMNLTDDTEAKACKDALYSRAVAILEARWSVVEAVAAALVIEGAIDRPRLLALAGGQRPAPRPRKETAPRTIRDTPGDG
jgi:ATP-dependent Zn protease